MAIETAKSTGEPESLSLAEIRDPLAKKLKGMIDRLTMKLDPIPSGSDQLAFLARAVHGLSRQHNRLRNSPSTAGVLNFYLSGVNLFFSL